MGAYFGKGKRTNVYGAFLLACFDSDNEQYQTICKIGTGFSDENLLDFHKTLQPLELEKPRGDIDIGGAKPDVWFKPSIVWEVLAADLSLSPIYTAAQGTVSKALFYDHSQCSRWTYIIRLTNGAYLCDFLDI